MILLLPGRHHLLTAFQYATLVRLIARGCAGERDANGDIIEGAERVDAVLFPVTSANHANTRRNPVPFYLRAMAVESFRAGLGVPTYVYGIDDVGSLPDFAAYTIKRIAHLSDNEFKLHPGNTLVLCSSPVLALYEAAGFRVLPMELVDRASWSYSTDVPWSLVERIAFGSGDWRSDPQVVAKVHPATLELWSRYRIGERVRLLFRDRLLGDDGDLTTTRDYNSYVRQMDEIAKQKFLDTAPYIRPGRIGDIGCAVGSWLKFTASQERFRESDLYGIEVVRHLFDICEQRKGNGEFENPFVFFSQKNAITGLVFEPGSMNTIHTSSLTHEIESYGGRADLQRFIANRCEELCSGGVWINRDVVGPSDAGREVYLWLTPDDGKPGPCDRAADNTVGELSTYHRFLRFARDFRAEEGYSVNYTPAVIEDLHYVRCSLRDACEFLSKKDYCDNWRSEMHETFCFWSFREWVEQVTAAGFTVHPDSRAYANQWIVENRFRGKAALFTMENGALVPLDWPDTTMILIAEKR